MTCKDKAFNSLTFSQREGKAPLPGPMQLHSIPEVFRNLIWRAIDTEISLHSTDSQSYILWPSFPKIVESYQFDVKQQRHDNIPNSTPSYDRDFTRNVVFDGEYHEVITFVEYILRHDQCPKRLKHSLVEAFDDCPIAYFVVETNDTPTVVPRITPEMGEATIRAIETVQDEGIESATVHLTNAADQIISREYGDSIRNSIHAVEAVARKISPKSDNSLKSALDTLEKEGVLRHRALKIAFEKLYGYTSDEQGIRHALLDQKTADVGLDEAVFMFGACASFAAYLVNKQRVRDG